MNAYYCDNTKQAQSDLVGYQSRSVGFSFIVSVHSVVGNKYFLVKSVHSSNYWTYVVFSQVRIQSDPAGKVVITGQPEQLDNPWGITPFKKVKLSSIFQICPLTELIQRLRTFLSFWYVFTRLLTYQQELIRFTHPRSWACMDGCSYEFRLSSNGFQESWSVVRGFF